MTQEATTTLKTIILDFDQDKNDIKEVKEILEHYLNTNSVYKAHLTVHHSFKPLELMESEGTYPEAYEMLDELAGVSVCWNGVTTKGIECDINAMVSNLLGLGGEVVIIGNLTGDLINRAKIYDMLVPPHKMINIPIDAEKQEGIKFLTISRVNYTGKWVEFWFEEGAVLEINLSFHGCSKAGRLNQMISDSGLYNRVMQEGLKGLRTKWQKEGPNWELKGIYL